MAQIQTLRIFWLLLFALFFSGMLSLALLCRFAFKPQSKTKEIIARFSLLIGTLGLCWFLLEFLFGFVIVQSDGFGHTFTSRLWHDRYWKPINAYGYRDYGNKEFSNKKIVYIVGDSFVAGHGIDRIENRFANTLVRMLGTKWEHVVIACNGWQTLEEFNAMTNYPATPDIVVLSYYINDIQSAAERLGFHVPNYYAQPGPLAKVLINKSFFLNFVYWRIYRGTMGNEYFDYLSSCYANNDIWEVHQKELQAFISYSRQRQIPIFVIVWPYLASVSKSDHITKKVVDFLRSKDVPVIDLANRYRNADPRALIVNSLDGHPNDGVNREVAELIYKTLEEADVVRSTTYSRQTHDRR